jgi:hypothetical protein
MLDAQKTRKFLSRNRPGIKINQLPLKIDNRIESFLEGLCLGPIYVVLKSTGFETV